MNLKNCLRIDFGFRLLPSYPPLYKQMILAGIVFTEFIQVLKRPPGGGGVLAP